AGIILHGSLAGRARCPHRAACCHDAPIGNDDDGALRTAPPYRVHFGFELTSISPYPAAMAKPTKKATKALMLGIGLDSDGHKRVTTGPNFALVGGSKETHADMTEKAVKTTEKLSRKGKTLDTV